MSLPDLEQTGVIIFFGALLLSVGLLAWDILEPKDEYPAFKQGGVPERFGVLIFIYMLAVQGISYSAEGAGPKYELVDQASVLSDLVGLTGFLALSLNARRFWPLFCTALQGCSLIFHYAKDILPDIIPLAYSIQKSTPTTLALLILLGAQIHRRWRVERQGWDVDWSVAGYAELYRKTKDRAILWAYLKAFGRSWLGLPMMIWGALVLAYWLVFAWVGGTAPTTMVILGFATLAVGVWYHNRENQLVHERVKGFNSAFRQVS